jgi:hypothetical protein
MNAEKPTAVVDDGDARSEAARLTDPVHGMEVVAVRARIRGQNSPAPQRTPRCSSQTRTRKFEPCCLNEEEP